MTTREELLVVAGSYQPEIEALYRRMLEDLVRLPDHRRPAWADFADPAVVSALGEVEGVAWNRAVSAFWLDACLANGSPAPDSPQGGDAR